ncbi:MAG: NAD(P)-dependent glycerol-3-phosphate dehydrogenase [Rhodospirillales bacterium]|nr:NAD(P)-dependent glycerol-3-phosphate dehydrogenase [Rhodospirillales bacterium]
MDGNSANRIGIVGAGAWGTALATVAARAGCDVMLWSREPDVADDINDRHENARFLPGVRLGAAIRATADIEAATNARTVLLAVPAQHLRTVLAEAAGSWRHDTCAVICAKGIETESGALMSAVVAEALPAAPVAVLSGPSFAAEVARDLPTAVTLASADAGVRTAVPRALGTPHFRIYSSSDVVGVEIGGAVKNVLAIAAGIVSGRGLGENARAALITRGLTEMARLAAAHGADPVTLMGLSGLGDLILTASATQSRNFSLGVALGRGEALMDILAARNGVTEGVTTAPSVAGLARRRGVDMPICFAVDAVLHRGADIDATIAALLSRPLTTEEL